MYESDGWVLRLQLKNKLQVVETKFLRIVNGITRRDGIRNDIVNMEVEVEPLIHCTEQMCIRDRYKDTKLLTKDSGNI